MLCRTAGSCEGTPHQPPQWPSGPPVWLGRYSGDPDLSMEARFATASCQGWHQHYHEGRHHLTQTIFSPGVFSNLARATAATSATTLSALTGYHQAGLIFVAIETHRTASKGRGPGLGVGEAHRTRGEVDVLGPDRSRFHRREEYCHRLCRRSFDNGMVGSCSSGLPLAYGEGPQIADLEGRLSRCLS